MPEEHTRIEVDRIAWLLFCPDDRSRTTLTNENVLGRIYVVGDVMADATLRFAPIARAAPPGALPAAHLRRRHGSSPGERLPAAPGTDRRGAEPARGARDLPGAPAYPVPARAREARARAARPSHRTAQLPRARLPRLAGPRDRDGLRRPAEGGVLVRRPLRDAFGRPPSGWTPCHGRERARRRRPRRSRRGRRRCRLPARRPVLYGDGHASERITQVLLATMPGR